jgi:phospholipase/lecithinase/hemolysin
MIQKFNKLLATFTFFIVACLPFTAQAGDLPYDTIIFFGDSLTDNGNLHHRTAGFIPKSPPYFEGRFSNGPTWAELVADHYHNKNAVSVDNYGVGSACAVFHNPAKGYLPYTLTMEVYNYLLRYAFSDKSHTLYTIWIGANDYFNGSDDVDKATTSVVNSIGNNIEKLIGRGGKYFLLMNLPDLAATPWGRASKNPANLTESVLEHNRKLAIKVAELQKHNPDIIIRLYDINKDFQILTTDPDVYNKKYNVNLTDLTETCWPGGYTLKRDSRNGHDILVKKIKQHLQHNASLRATDDALNFADADQLADTILNSPSLAAAYDVSTKFEEGQKVCQNPDNHLFWDMVHPTRVVHNVFSQIMVDYIDQNYV